MVFLGFPPYFIFTSFLTTLLLDRGVHVTGNKQFPTSSPWNTSPTPPQIAKSSRNESEALKKVLPLVTFDCRAKTGYFPDSKFNCEVFHYCQPDGGRNTFHCPDHQLFNQLSMVCEEKTTLNSKLCREGSINPSNFPKFPSNKKHDTTKKTASATNPLFNSNSSIKASPQKIVTLEDLLSYMNSGQGGKEAEPTFVSRFHKADGSLRSKTIPNSAIITTKPETKSKHKKPSISIDLNLKPEGSSQTYSVEKSPPKPGGVKSKKNLGEEEVVSAEYDAIEGRKFTREHKRAERVIDAEVQSKKEKPHSHITERAASDAPQQESTTPLDPTDNDPKDGNSPSLFPTDRNKARKKKRYQGRKRKPTTPGTGNETHVESDSLATTAVPTLQTVRQDYDTVRNNNNANRRRKSQRARVRDSAHRPHKVEPYTLPPLPTYDDEKTEAATESMQKEEKRRSKNPWHKPVVDDAAKYGEKLSDLDQHHYQTDVKMTQVPAPPEAFYGSKDIPNTPDALGEEYSKKFLMHSTNSGDTRSSHGSQIKNLKTHISGGDDDGYKYGSHPEKHPTMMAKNIFPPPRAEAREHHSNPPKQMTIGHESDDEKAKTYSSPKATTTEDPFRVTYPYRNKYQTEVKESKDLEENRWKTDSDKAKSENKVAVGSTFFFQNSQTPETTKKPKLQMPTTTVTPITTDVNTEKDASKHTLAHQHLSKIMNDFFAMSSTNVPGRVHLDSNRNEEDIIIPEYRIQDEDIYTGSESVSDDVEEIPPELLEVVDLITGNVRKEKSDPKPRSSHEVIKINGPITDSHLEKIFLDDNSDEDAEEQSSEMDSFKKIVVIPQPEDKEENRDLEEMEELTSLKLEPFLKQFSDEKPLAMIPLNSESVQKRQPTVLTAKKIPVRVIYRDQLAEAIRTKQPTRKPNVKMAQTHLTQPRRKIYSHDKIQTTRPLPHPFASHSQPPIILHPPTLFPPHPPPLLRKQYPFRVGYPFVTNSMSHLQNTRTMHSRKKRSIISNRLRRQIRQNQHFLPFSGPVYPSFNPKFVPTFSPFKALFSPSSLQSASTHLTPFTFPGYSLEKPSQNKPRGYRPDHARPPPVRHVTQSGHQTVIVEEVPVPIHVEVPTPNLIHPSPSGGNSPKVQPRYPGNQYRSPSPPAIQPPPLLQRPQGRFPPPPNNYQLFGMPADARPPQMDYRSPLPLTGPLPPRITSDGQIYALGVTNKPILPPSNPRPARPPNGGPNPLPRPHNPFNIHANEYPNFPYFQGAFTTPISNEPVPGRVMYSGYKPPKSTAGTKPPKPQSTSNKDRKTSESNSNRSRSKPSQDYFNAPGRPMRESHVSYTEEVLSRGRSKPKPNLNDFPIDNIDLKAPRENLNKNSATSDEVVPKKRRPSRRRRPRPHSTTTTQGTPIRNDISPTPPPPEQIPPPPADYTSKPSQPEVLSSLPSLSFSEGPKTQESSSHFPPAGYYGKDQLIQFFDSSSKPHQKTTSPRPYHLKNLGESRSSTELDDSMASMSMEDGNEPAFGTRLRSKSPGQSRSRQVKNKQPSRSQTQKNEVRTRPNKRPEETIEKKENTQPKPNEDRKTQTRPDQPPPRRRRPPPPRPRSRPPPPPMSRPHPEIHHFNGNVRNFYSVPPGLQNLVAPQHTQHGFRGSTDMFGLPHPVIDQGIYSLRPHGAPVDFEPNFFSVPTHVAQQQQSPLHKMNIKPVPESARQFFTAPDPGSQTVPEASAPEKRETEQKGAPGNRENDQKGAPNKQGGENNEKSPPVRKLRKPKRKNRYNPHSTEQRDNAEVNSVKPQTEQTTPKDSSSTMRYKEKSTTSATPTAEPRSTASTNDIKSTHYNSQNDIKETPAVFKQRTPLLPKTLPELSKSLLNGKIDIQKLNATISTSVSVSGAFPQTNNTSSEEKENKRVFSSQNGGGLAVVRKGPKRKRARQRVSTTTGVPYVNNESSTDAKYEIAASVLDIIKATTETERQASGYYDSHKNEKPSSSRVSNTWVESPSKKRHHA